MRHARTFVCPRSTHLADELMQEREDVARARQKCSVAVAALQVRRLAHGRRRLGQASSGVWWDVGGRWGALEDGSGAPGGGAHQARTCDMRLCMAQPTDAGACLLACLL